MQPRLSIVIPAYNAEEYLTRCLDSIFSQEFTDLEVIVINDGSVDGTERVLIDYREKEPRLYFFNQTNNGVVNARNLGLSRALGEWIMFVDSDDYLFTGALSNMIAKSEEAEADIVVANIIYDYGSKLVKRINKSPKENNFKELSKALFTDTIAPSIWSKIYKRILFNGIIVSEEFKIGEDFILTVLLFQKSKKIRFTSFFSYGYFQRDGSVMHKPSNAAINSIPKFITWIIDFYSNQSFFFDEDFQNEISYFVINRYYLFLSYGGKLTEDDKLLGIVNNNYLNRKNIRQTIPLRRQLILHLFKRSNVLGYMCLKILSKMK